MLNKIIEFYEKYPWSANLQSWRRINSNREANAWQFQKAIFSAVSTMNPKKYLEMNGDTDSLLAMLKANKVSTKKIEEIVIRGSPYDTEKKRLLLEKYVTVASFSLDQEEKFDLISTSAVGEYDIFFLTKKLSIDGVLIVDKKDYVKEFAENYKELYDCYIIEEKHGCALFYKRPQTKKEPNMANEVKKKDEVVVEAPSTTLDNCLDTLRSHYNELTSRNAALAKENNLLKEQNGSLRELKEQNKTLQETTSAQGKRIDDLQGQLDKVTAQNLRWKEMFSDIKETIQTAPQEAAQAAGKK